MSKNILITGISGFVGHNLVGYFSSCKDYTLYGLDIVSPELDWVANIFSWDDLNSISDMDVVVHLTGKAHDLKKTSYDQAYYDINYGLTQKIFDWYLKSSALS